VALYVGTRGSNFFGQAATPFFGLRDGRRVSQSIARRIFANVRELAGVRRQDQFRYQPRLHDLRHTAITSMAEKLPNLIELSAVTGHKSLSMLKRYYHPSAENLARKLG
jgi:integrase